MRSLKKFGTTDRQKFGTTDRCVYRVASQLKNTVLVFFNIFILTSSETVSGCSMFLRNCEILTLFQIKSLQIFTQF